METLDNIVFSEDDTQQQTAIKTVHLWAGTNELKTQLKKLGIEYVKTYRGVDTIYILRGAKIGRFEVNLREKSKNNTTKTVKKQ